MRLTFLPYKHSIKKSWDVDADTDDADWGYIKPGFFFVVGNLNGKQIPRNLSMEIATVMKILPDIPMKAKG